MHYNKASFKAKNFPLLIKGLQYSYSTNFLQVIDVETHEQILNGVPELLCLSSIGLSILCLFICPCVLVCTLPAIGASTAVS